MNQQLSDCAIQDVRVPADSDLWDLLYGAENRSRQATASCTPAGRDLGAGEKLAMETLTEPFGSGAASRSNGVTVPAEPFGQTQQDLKARLRQCQKMETLGRLTGRVAHDFNNLLTVIRGYSDMLQQCLGSDDALRANLVEQIQKAADLGASLTWQLLTYSRKPTRVPVRVDLGALLTDLEKMLRLLINRNIELVLIQDRDLGRVEADPGQMEQVIVNLVLNARDAMPGGGRLMVETAEVVVEGPAGAAGPRRPGRYAMLAVSDTGCGMDAETRSRLFEPFFTTKEVGRGTGLGLAVVWDIVEAAGGFVEVASGLGQGTVVRVYLPLAASAALQCA
jgi:signal transduction histidine kinase